ncbi:hypothetical protein BKI52_35605 [marine bacterium AO1-C]|nr:hypothetical protein BKI52_35605 [marine bacterium AO1-C]
MKTGNLNHNKKSKGWRKSLYEWLVISSDIRSSNPWQAIHLLTRRLRSLVAILAIVALIGTGITFFIFLFPLRLPQWLPILHLLLLVFFICVLLFMHFRKQGNQFYQRFLEEVLQIRNNQQTIKIPRDKRKILKQFEWYSQGQILKVNLIALGLATIFGLAPKKVINALSFRKQTVSQQLERLILTKHQQIAYYKTLNEQSQQIVKRLERNNQNNLSHIKRLKKGMHRHYRQIIELRRYLWHIGKVRKQIRQLKKIGHSEVWKQERVIKANKLVMNHIKGLVQARLEQKEKPIKLADGMLKKYGKVLKTFGELGVRYRKFKRRVNNFSYRNSLEIKRAKKNMESDQILVEALRQEIDNRLTAISDLKKALQQDEKRLKNWKTREQLEKEQVQ